MNAHKIPIYKTKWFKNTCYVVITGIGISVCSAIFINAINDRKEQAKQDNLLKSTYVTKPQLDNSCAILQGQINDKAEKEIVIYLREDIKEALKILMELKLQRYPIHSNNNNIQKVEPLPEIKPIQINQLEAGNCVMIKLTTML